MRQLLVLNPENIPEVEYRRYRIRKASRAVVIDEAGDVALLYAPFNKYHKLPGGGIDEGETPEEALVRECREEIGCDVVITKPLGIIVEYRKHSQLHQISYCYGARAVGKKGEPVMTEKEKSEGLEVVWMPLCDALRAVASGATDTYKSQYVIPRELNLLQIVASTNGVV